MNDALSSQWRLRTLNLSLERPLIMGILNLTPDSFSEGGRHFSLDAARKRALQIVDEGADLIDIGAESTRPGAPPISAAEEWSRLVPVLRILRSEISLPMSIDTRHGEVARQALDWGAELINDVSLAGDPDLLNAVAECRCGYVLMHSRGEPQTMMERAEYRNLMSEVIAELEAALDRVRAAGIPLQQVVLDPGFGFAKTPEQNWELLARLPELKQLNLPLLAGLSRKRLLRELVGESEEALKGASVAVAAAAVAGGARIVRVHDVAATRASLQVLQKTGLIP